MVYEYVHGQNLAPPNICNVLKNKINFIWKKLLVLYVFTALKNNLNHEKKNEENTPVEPPLCPLQKNIPVYTFAWTWFH